MTIPDDPVTNLAGDATTVGVQAGVVHGDVSVYQSTGESAEEKYRIGVDYLDGGMPTRARELIRAAMAGRHEASQVRFHWLLALLSGRTIRQFSAEDESSLRAERERPAPDTHDQWADGIRVINCLLDAADAPETDLELVTKKLDDLDAIQRHKILQHLDTFLSGHVEDRLWDRALRWVKDEQLKHDRQDRAWMFFQPAPARPRLRQPVAPITAAAVWYRLIIAGVGFITSAGWLGWLLVENGKFVALAIGLISTLPAYNCFSHGLEWRDRVERRRAKDWQRRPPEPQVRSAPQGGFANSIDKLFLHYFAKYNPDAASRATLLAQTAGLRKYLRDEIVDEYREQRIKAAQIAWLIRHVVGDIIRSWRNDTLWDYRDQLRTPAATKTSVILGLVTIVAGGAWFVSGAIPADPLGAAAWGIALAAGGWIAISGALRIKLECRRYDAEHAEWGQRLKVREAVFRRWQERLAPRPADTEMARWLDCDRRILIDQTMRHYKLAPRDIIAHAAIEAPAASSKKARVRNGPWRYTRYQVLVFLLTAKGVRQVTAELDFAAGSFHGSQRVNYRFDAVASVAVTETDDKRRTFELRLVNGEPISIPVTEPSTDHLLPGEQPEALSDITMDAAGLTGAMHVLEGIAAEGKDWIGHENQRRDSRFAAFAAGAQDSGHEGQL